MKGHINQYFKQMLLVFILSVPILAQTSDLKTEESKEKPDARIVVNVPAFKLFFYRGDTLVKSYPVTIGSRDYSSPYGVERKAIQLSWNPSWTPPPSDWARSERPAAPGAANNPLGRLKIRLADFPFLIHGGGDKSINLPVSHGCVRLRNADALELARLIIDACKLSVTEKQISGFIADRYREHSVKITGNVLVEFRYDTITIEDGRVNIYPDIYKEGTNTVENLTYVLYKAGINYSHLSPEQQTDLNRALEESSKNKAKRQEFHLSTLAETKKEENHKDTKAQRNF